MTRCNYYIFTSTWFTLTWCSILYFYLDKMQLLYILIWCNCNIFTLTWCNYYIFTLTWCNYYIFWNDAIVMYLPLHVGRWLMIWQNSPTLQDSQEGSRHWESSQALFRGQSASVSQSKARIVRFNLRSDFRVLNISFEIESISKKKLAKIQLLKVLQIIHLKKMPLKLRHQNH